MRTTKPSYWKGSRAMTYVLVSTSYDGSKSYGRWYDLKESADYQLERKLKVDSTATLERMSRGKLHRIHLQRSIDSLIATYDTADRQKIIAALKETT